MAIFEIISATDSLTQNIIRIVCLYLLIFDIFNLRILGTMRNYVHQLINIRLVFHTPYL